jgi:hypothetical protein
MIERRLLHLLGRHVKRAPEQRPLDGDGALRVVLLREAEVDDLRLHVAGVERREKHVRRLEIAVDDPALVRVRERVGDGEQHAHSVDGGKPAVLAEVVREVHAAQELHHDVRIALRRLAEVEHADDRRMIEPRSRPRLLEKAACCPRSRRALREELDRDGDVEREVDRDQISAAAPRPMRCSSRYSPRPPSRRRTPTSSRCRSRSIAAADRRGRTTPPSSVCSDSPNGASISRAHERSRFSAPTHRPRAPPANARARPGSRTPRFSTVLRLQNIGAARALSGGS